jgi:hypothetical protein
LITCHLTIIETVKISNALNCDEFIFTHRKILLVHETIIGFGNDSTQLGAYKRQTLRLHVDHQSIKHKVHQSIKHKVHQSMLPACVKDIVCT